MLESWPEDVLVKLVKSSELLKVLQTKNGVTSWNTWRFYLVRYYTWLLTKRLLFDMKIVHPPCYIIVERVASNQDNGVPLRNPAWFISIMFQCKASTTCEEGLKAFSIIHTWHNLCSEHICPAFAAQQHNGVGKRGRCPCYVIPSRHTVNAFKKNYHAIKPISGGTSYCKV